ncbi:hypothetical protein PR202_ga05687 [Eleusine coracana subsp. coracana]|uniref:Uncharacterized protein n=1 Tax=Eleusine coracana subsp. coracana TaxID=191504 RepID=A0AAV5BT10_ELECO|nr:hypothetical protein QOZ80_5AG0366410 [Eleusine coracana subsp. coracana]GJM89089.1 hypothetical protein PR202_ga05233 [Eleusine coracana subsp. coracana]GJM89490.1 hypothetical protein PR202_ga05687 [Eleusine coracana subsp. coracana]
MEEEEEEFQEADVLWPWPEDTPSPSPSPEEAEYSLLAPPGLYERDEDTVVGFSCEPFSGPEASSLSSASTSSALLFDRSPGESSEDGFFLSGRSSSTVVSGLAESSAEEFLEKDVLWPDTADDDYRAAEFWCRRCRSVEEAVAASASGKREGWRILASSPIDIPVATGAAAARRRPSPSAVPFRRRHW